MSDDVFPLPCPVCKVLGAITFPQEQFHLNPSKHERVAEVCPICGARSYWVRDKRKAVRGWNFLVRSKPARLRQLALKYKEEHGDNDAKRVQVR